METMVLVFTFALLLIVYMHAYISDILVLYAHKCCLILLLSIIAQHYIVLRTTSRTLV
jgi:hypothetical protein